MAVFILERVKPTSCPIRKLDEILSLETSSRHWWPGEIPDKHKSFSTLKCQRNETLVQQRMETRVEEMGLVYSTARSEGDRYKKHWFSLMHLYLLLISGRQAPNCALRIGVADLSCYQIESSWQRNILHFTFCYQFFLISKCRFLASFVQDYVFPQCVFLAFFLKKYQVSVVKEGYIDVSVDLCFVFVPTKCWFINTVLYNNLKSSVVEYCFCLRLLRQYLVFCPYISIFWNYF